MSDCQEILIGLNSILEQQRQEATAAEDNQIVILPEPAVNTGDGDSID